MESDSDAIDLRAQGRVLRYRWRVIALMTVLGLVIALALALTKSPTYSATSEVLIDPMTTQTPTNGVVVQPEEIATQIEVVRSQPVANLVIQKLNLSGTATDLLRNVSVTVVGVTRALDIQVTRPKAADAAAIANAFASEYLIYRHDQAVADSNAALAGYNAQVSSLQKRLTSLSSRVDLAFGSKKVVLETRRQALLIQLTQATTQLAAINSPSLSAGKVLVEATTPKSQAGPKVVKSGILGALLGLLLGIGLAFLRDRQDDAVRDESRLGGVLGISPVLGQIPHWSKAKTNRIASVIEPRSPSSEAFRALGTNVRFLLAAAPQNPGRKRAGQILLLSSADPAEGKTSVAANLAVAAARVGVKVVLVDADLRNPALARLFGMDGSLGFSDVLASNVPVQDHLLDVGIPNLRVLPGGAIPPNPAELLASPQSAVALSQIRDNCDLVIVDSAPILSVADSLELVPSADLVMLVVRSRISRLRHVEAAVNRVKQVGGAVSGAVFNDVPVTDTAFVHSYTYTGPRTEPSTTVSEPTAGEHESTSAAQLESEGPEPSESSAVFSETGPSQGPTDSRNIG